MIFEVKCDEERTNELTDRTHTRIVSFIVLDIYQNSEHGPSVSINMYDGDISRLDGPRGPPRVIQRVARDRVLIS